MKNLFRLFQKVNSTNHTYLFPFLLVNIIALLIKAIQVMFPSQLIRGLEADNLVWIILCILLYVVILNLLNMGTVLTEYYREKNEYEINRRLTADLYAANAASAYADFEQYETRKKFELAKEGMQKGSLSVIIHSIITIISNFFFVLSVSYIFQYLDGRISIVLLAGAVINTVCEYYRMKYDYDCYRQLAEANTRMLYARDKLTWKQFGKEIRIFNLYEYVSGIAMKYINQLSQIQKTKSKRIFLVYFFLGLFDFVQRFGLIAYTVWLCLKGVVSIGEFTSFMVAMITCFSCVNDNAKILVQVAESMKYIKSYFDVLDAVEEKEQQKKKEISKDLGKLKTLQVTDLQFQYPNTDREILKGVSVSFEAGKKYGIVGRNGSGKTTFLKVLLGLYQVPDGTIQFNGWEKNYFSLKKWYSLFSVVLQDFNLYAYTLRDNIEMFQENKVTALKESDKIAGLNLEDYLSGEYEAGHTVSGGEAQKIAFSRAVHKKAEIVVLDEPTSALSPDSEIAFYEEMKHRLSDKTLILVSHRLASCKLCDEILVFDAGQIVERGTHEQLMQDKGIYYEMYTSQKNLYANEMQDKQSICV